MKQLIFFIACISILYSCKKEEPEPEPAPVTTGNLKGKVSHYDQFGALYTGNLNTTTVSVVGKNVQTITDANGFYNFADVSSGSYTLTFKKPGCGQAIIQDIQYKYTDTTNYNIDIADIPSFTISNAYLKDTTWFSGTLGGIYYNATTLPANNKAKVVAIIGKSPNITLADPLTYLNFGQTALVGSQDYGRFFSYSFLSQTYKFKKDSTIYFKIYPVAAIGSYYIDNQLNRPVYSAFGTPYATFTLTMP